MFARTKTSILLVLVIAILLVAGFVALGRANSSSGVDWLSADPAVVSERSYANITDFPSHTCSRATVKVARTLNPLADTYEEHCFKSTFMGLMTDIYTSQGVVQPTGYAKALPVNYVAGGNPVAAPVPNQVSALVTTGYTQGPGVTMGMFRQLSNHMKLELGASGWRYNITGANSLLDMVFRYSDGSVAVFNSGAQAMASSGRYLLIDSTKGGFVRIDLMNLTSKPVATTLPRVGGTNQLNIGAAAIDSDGRMAAVSLYGSATTGTAFAKLIDTNACPYPETSSITILATINCPSRDVMPVIKQSLPGATAVTIHQMHFINDRTLMVDVQYKDQQGAIKNESLSLTAAGQPKRLKEYLALGDSFISGEGAFSYKQGTDTNINRCHQSLLSHPYINSTYFESSASVACSGARMQNITKNGDGKIHQTRVQQVSDSEIVSAINEYMPGLALQSKFVEKDNPEAVTLSIGGNDIGFADILQKCINPFKDFRSGLDNDFTCYTAYEDRQELVKLMDSQYGKLKNLYSTLRNDGAAGRRLYVIGYPQIAKVDGDCGLNVGLNAQEVRFASKLVSHLNGVIKKAADDAGVQYVDTEAAFNGHRLCDAAAGRSAVNGITIVRGPDGAVDLAGSYHPTALGHELLAAEIARQTDNLHKPMPIAAGQVSESATLPDAPIYEGAALTGRPVRDVRYAGDMLGSLVKLGQTVETTVDSRIFLTKPSATYTATIGGRPVGSGSFTADAAGVLRVTGAVDAATPPGFQTFSVIGPDIFGAVTETRQTVYVAITPDDSDGDGLPDSSDYCLLTTQSGSDGDGDGIDDACDPEIGLPPATPPGGGVPDEGIVWWDNAVLPISIQTTVGP